MSHAIPFDTLAFVKELETAGVPPAQAEAQTRALSAVLQKVEETRLSELVTKGDLQLEIEKIRREIAETKADLIKWMIGLAMAQLGLLTGILIAILRLTPHS